MHKDFIKMRNHLLGNKWGIQEKNRKKSIVCFCIKLSRTRV